MANNSRTPNQRARQDAPNRKFFYAALIAIALIGAGTIVYQKQTHAAPPQQSDPTLDAMRQTYANAGPPKPYVLGDSNAKVVVEEFADYECPSCGNFATVTEPDVRKRLVETGQVFYKYYDFPLPMHKNSHLASLAAACADEQGKFWQLHDALFGGQDQWGLGPSETEVTDDPRPVFLGYAQKIGLNTSQWESCLDTKKYESRVIANAAEALRRNIEETPTFYVNGKKMVGALPFDNFKKEVDAAAQAGPASAADSAFNNIVTH